MSQSAYLIVLVALIGSVLRVSTPFMFVALGECLTEKSGRVNLGIEGTLVLGECQVTRSPTKPGRRGSRVLAAGCSGSVLGAMHGYICKLPRVNDIAVGIAMMLFGTGVAFFFGKPYIQPSAPQLSSFSLGAWTGNAEVTSALQINPLLLVGIAVGLIMAWGFANTRMGSDHTDDWRRRAVCEGDGCVCGSGAIFVHHRWRFPGRRRRCVPVTILSGLLKSGIVVGPRPHGRGAGDLRPLEPDPLHHCRIACSAPLAPLALPCNPSASRKAITFSTRRLTSSRCSS